MNKKYDMSAIAGMGTSNTKYLIQQRCGTSVIRESIVVDFTTAREVEKEWERTDLNRYGMIKYINQTTDIRITVINSQIADILAV